VFDLIPARGPFQLEESECLVEILRRDRRGCRFPGVGVWRNNHCRSRYRQWASTVRSAVLTGPRQAFPLSLTQHVPPSTYPYATGEEAAAAAAELLQLYRPEYFISGHAYRFPYISREAVGRETSHPSLWAQLEEPGYLGAQFVNLVVVNLVVLVNQL